MTSCWVDDFGGSPEGCTFQHEYSFVEVDVDELYSIRVIQYMTDIKKIMPREVSPFASSADSASERLLPVCTYSSSFGAENWLPREAASCKSLALIALALFCLALALLQDFCFGGIKMEALKSTK
jgi:hypothetical protein